MKTQMVWRLASVLALLAGVLVSLSSSASVTASLQLYGTFNATGVVVTLADTDDPDGDATATIEYRTDGAPYRKGFPLSRINNTHFVGSLFWLQPDTAYDVRVTFRDPDGGPLDGTTVEATAVTRAEIVFPASQNTYYVSPTGSGTACALVAPCSLSEGLSHSQPGDEVVLRGGIYYQGEIDLPRSGTVGAPILVRGYEGETAVLDGADPDSFV